MAGGGGMRGTSVSNPFRFLVVFFVAKPNPTNQLLYVRVWDEPPLKEPVKVSCYHLKHIPAL